MPGAELVGRDEVLALAARRWSEVTAGQGQTLLIAGEAGIGKSRILNEIVSLVGGAPGVVLLLSPTWWGGSETDVLDEALKKSTVVWVEVPGEGGTGGRAVPVWYGTLDGRVYVLVGGSEQHVPGLAEADRAVLIARSKEQQSLVAEVEASARVVPPSDPLYARVAPVLLPRRLNLRDGEAAVDRWRKECTLVELTPSAIPAEV